MHYHYSNLKMERKKQQIYNKKVICDHKYYKILQNNVLKVKNSLKLTNVNNNEKNKNPRNFYL